VDDPDLLLWRPKRGKTQHPLDFYNNKKKSVRFDPYGWGNPEKEKGANAP
jgi:hypothetical protein